MHRFSACQFNFGPDEQLQILVRTALVSHSALSHGAEEHCEYQ